MVYVSSVERIARKEGLEAGRAEGVEKACQAIRQTIQDRLEQRWGTLESDLKTSLEAIDDFQRLLELHVLAATAPNLQDWTAGLKA